ncbi:hypothetical protein [Burkholderia gladioli]|uniref:hypothetical protein n=1 Tax=Burkholderia gladioli TaxID=28095 RepID=UPI0015E6A78D|nr:hypothetical protein [Burkholderia gladioli]MBA1366945.1 hypothetical protein [Burkholderia gladioli]
MHASRAPFDATDLAREKMDTKKLKPFDLEAAKRGELMVTRSGKAAKFIAYVPEAEDAFHILVLIDKTALAFYGNGHFYSNEDHHNDLFMAPRKVKRWVNLYAHGGAWHYGTEEEAKTRIANNDSVAIAIAVPVEIEE